MKPSFNKQIPHNGTAAGRRPQVMEILAALAAMAGLLLLLLGDLQALAKSEWLGSSPKPFYMDYRHLFFTLGVVVLAGLPLGMWNYSLRRNLSRNTSALGSALHSLQTSEEKWRLLFNESGAPIFIVSCDGTYHCVNTAFSALFVKQPEEIIGLKIGDLFPAEEAQRSWEVIKDVIMSGRTRVYEGLVPRPGGGFSLVTRVTPVKDEQGRVTSVIGIYKDKNASGRDEETLKARQIRKRLAMDLAKLAHWEYDVDSDLFTLNDQFYTLYGTTAQEQGGMRMSAAEYARRFLPPEEAHLLNEARDKALAASDPSFSNQLEHRIILGDGQQRIVCVRYAIVKDADGRTIKAHGAVQDITERQQAMEALMASEKRFRAQYEGSPIATLTCRKQGEDFVLIEFNNSARSMIGINVLGLVGRKATQLCTNRQEILSNLLRCHEDRKVISRETRLEHCLPEKFLVITYAFVPPDLVLVHLEDITERKLAEEALKESEKKYRELYDFLPIPVYEMDFESNITSVNRAVYETFRGTEEDFQRGFKARQFLSAEGVEKSIKNIQRLFMGEQLAGTEYDLIRLDGSTFPAIVISSAIFRDGKPVGLRSAIIDITQRRQQEEELRWANTFLDSIVENIPDMIFLKDAEELRFIRFNRAGEELLGYPRQEMLGKNDYDLFPEEQADFFTEKDREALRQKEVVDIPEELLRSRTKGERILHTKKVPIPDATGKPEYVLGISEDITERKHTEDEKETLQAQLLQAQRLEAIGTLAGGIAHDFNNILGVILGFTELTLMKMDKESRHWRNTHEVFRAAVRAKELVRQILTFSRQSKQEREPMMVDLVLKEVLKFLRSSIPATVEIRQVIGEDVGPIIGNPTQIHQVIMNLCVNASHAMREKGGTLEVTLSNADMSSEEALKFGVPKGPYCRLQVSDTGHGMDDATRERIFDPYFTTKRPGEGTGLGLAVVHGIVTSHGGGIVVKSRLGQGSTFDVLLPRMEKAVAVPVVLETGPPLGNGETILVVDDEPRLAQVYGDLLESLGYRAEVKNIALEAYQTFSTNPDRYDLVFSDLTMPHMTGLELAELIRKIRSDVPIVLCTGFNDVITEEKMREQGISMLVMKPIVRQDLAEAIRKAIKT